MGAMRTTEPPLVLHQTRRAAMALAVAGLATGVRASPKEHIPSSRWYEAALQRRRASLACTLDQRCKTRALPAPVHSPLARQAAPTTH